LPPIIPDAGGGGEGGGPLPQGVKSREPLWRWSRGGLFAG